MDNKDIAEKILNTLTKQSFADWYNEHGRFDQFICGDEDAPTQEEILDDIKKLFDLDI